RDRLTAIPALLHSDNYISTASACFLSFHAPATSQIYTLSLHDALPISDRGAQCREVNPAQPAGRPQAGDRHDQAADDTVPPAWPDRKSTRLNSSHQIISYAVFCLKKKKKINTTTDIE